MTMHDENRRRLDSEILDYKMADINLEANIDSDSQQ